MNNVFEWLLANRKAHAFLQWAREQGHDFSYATLNRGKGEGPKTSRQRLMAIVAEQYKQTLEQRTVEAA